MSGDVPVVRLLDRRGNPRLQLAFDDATSSIRCFTHRNTQLLEGTAGGKAEPSLAWYDGAGRVLRKPRFRK